MFRPLCSGGVLLVSPAVVGLVRHLEEYRVLKCEARHAMGMELGNLEDYQGCAGAEA